MSEIEIEELRKSVDAGNLLSFDKSSCTVEPVAISIENSASPLSWCASDTAGRKLLSSKRHIALEVPEGVIGVKAIPLLGPLRLREYPQYASVQALMEGTEGRINPRLGERVYVFQGLSFKARSLIKKLGSIQKDPVIKEGLILFEATLRLHDGRQHSAFLDYAVKYQFLNSNGEAAKKRRKLDLNSGTQMLPQESNPFRASPAFTPPLLDISEVQPQEGIHDPASLASTPPLLAISEVQPLESSHDPAFSPLCTPPVFDALNNDGLFQSLLNDTALNNGYLDLNM